MQLTRYTDYGLRILVYLSARPPATRASIDEVSRVFGISRNHVNKIIHQLGRDGWISTQRGKGGGFVLALHPAEIRLGAVVRSLETNMKLVDCEQPSPCVLKPSCLLKGVLADAVEAFLAVLDTYVLQDLIDGSEVVTLLQHHEQSQFVEL